MNVYTSSPPINNSNILLKSSHNIEPVLFIFNFSVTQVRKLEHVYMRPEVNSNRFEIANRFEMSFRLHGNLHRDLTAASFQTIARPYCTCANDIF